VTVAGYQTVAQRNLTCAIRIRERRRELGLTQAEVVDRVSQHGSRLSNQALSAIENGRRLAVGRLPDLADALGCTVTYLLGLTDDPGSWQPDTPRAPSEQAPSQQAPSQQAPSQQAPARQAPARTRGPAARDPGHSSRRSWILGPDVPDVPGELRSRAYGTGTTTALIPRGRDEDVPASRHAVPARRRPGRHGMRFPVGEPSGTPKGSATQLTLHTSVTQNTVRAVLRG
jgi:transcriptional regulator with XRE-family HTH domain